MKLKNTLSDKQTKAAMGAMGYATFYERITKKTVPVSDRITVLEAYALSKAKHEKNLRSLSEVAYLIRHGEYHVEQIIDRFAKKDWDAVASGKTEYEPS